MLSYSVVRQGTEVENDGINHYHGEGRILARLSFM